MVVLIVLLSAWLLWAFLLRRVSWRYLRGALLTMPSIALTAVAMTEKTASVLRPSAPRRPRKKRPVG
jgi:hypothetical protein